MLTRGAKAEKIPDRRKEKYKRDSRGYMLAYGVSGLSSSSRFSVAEEESSDPFLVEFHKSFTALFAASKENLKQGCSCMLEGRMTDVEHIGIADSFQKSGLKAALSMSSCLGYILLPSLKSTMMI